MTDKLLEELLLFWRSRKEIEAVYLLPTSTAQSKDCLLLINESDKSYFERLDFYYPKEKRKKDLHVFPITQQELNNWPEEIRNQVEKTISQAKPLFIRKNVN